MQKFKNPQTTLLGKEQGELKERKKEKNAVNSGHLVLPTAPKGSARTLLGPTCSQVSMLVTMHVNIVVYIYIGVHILRNIHVNMSMFIGKPKVN